MDRKLFSHSLNEIINLGTALAGALQIQDRAEVDLNFGEKNMLQTKTAARTQRAKAREQKAYLYFLCRE
jgi:hypothetical protein